jgi:hypothetical protein
MIVGILTLIASLLGGDGLNYHLAHIEESVKEYVQDTERQNAVFAAGKELEEQMSEIWKAYSKEAEAFFEINNSYEAKPEDFDERTDKLLTVQEQVKTSVLNARDKMHEQMTEEEWNAVFRTETPSE